MRSEPQSLAYRFTKTMEALAALVPDGPLYDLLERCAANHALTPEQLSWAIQAATWTLPEFETTELERVGALALLEVLVLPEDERPRIGRCAECSVFCLIDQNEPRSICDSCVRAHFLGRPRPNRRRRGGSGRCADDDQRSH